jgi:type I restriction-modification system DNA methylase subunit
MLDDIKKALWSTADKLRANMDAAEYKHLVLGLIFVKYVSAGASDYQDIAGYCRSVKLAEIAEHGHVFTPGRYVGAEEVEDDDEVFADKMQKLTEKLGEQMAKGAELDVLIRQKLGGLGYEF